MSYKSPIFVGGTGRCGTTMLARSLGRHSNIAKLSREPRLIVDPGGLLDLIHNTSDMWGPYRADRAVWEFEHMWNEMRSDTNGRYGAHSLDQELGEEEWQELRDMLLDEFVNFVTNGRWYGTASGRNEIYEVENRHHVEAAEFVRRFTTKMFDAVNPEANYWIDDTPYTVQHLSTLWQTFPGMSMIHIHRHPIEVLASHQRVRIGNKMWPSESPVENARRLRGIYEGWIEELHRTRDAQEVARDLRLQDLAEEPETMFGRLCDFLNIEYDSVLAEEVSPDGINHDRSVIDELPSDEKDKVYKILEPVADWYGYDL